ncbi:MAG: extracellular solute-binding protein, partial [Gemmataceae bacterium]|nr:extracellular solute-binding protein [Gemmataceae bacterium]
MQRQRLIFLSSAAALLAGCLSYLPPPEPPPHAGTVLEAECPKELEGFLRAQSASWRGKHQAEVRPVAPGSRADLRLIRPAELPALAAGLLPIPEELLREGDAFEWRGLLRFYGSQLCRDGRATLAVPVLGGAPICLYRTDLVEKPPATWQEFREKALKQAGKRKAPSLPPLPSDNAALDRLFHLIAASHVHAPVKEDAPDDGGNRERTFFYHYDSKGEPRIGGGGFLDALRAMKAMQPARPERAAAEPMEEFRAGRAVLAIAEAGWIARLQQEPALRDKVAACPVPGTAKGRIPYLGGAGWLAVVPKDSRSPRAAWSLLADLAGPARSMQAAQEPAWGGGSTRLDPLGRDRWDSFGLDRVRARDLKDALEATLAPGIRNPALVLRTPDQAAKREA